MALKGRHRRKTTNEGKKIHQKLKYHYKNFEKEPHAGKQTLNFDCLRHIFDIVSSQISAMMEPSNAILGQKPTNRRKEISSRDITFLSSFFTINERPKYRVQTEPEVLCRAPAK